MLNSLLKGFLSAVALKLLDHYRQLSVQLLKIEATKAYLQGVRMARRSAFLLILMGIVLGLISMGALLFHVGLFILLPWTVEAKATFAIILGLACMVIGGSVLGIIMNEKTWMEKSGAAEMLNEATGQPHKE